MAYRFALATDCAGIHTCFESIACRSAVAILRAWCRVRWRLGGDMDVATEPPGTDSRRVPTPDAAPRCRPTPHTDQSCARHPPVLRECFGLPRALARVPAWDTPQVRPCRLQRGIHAAQGPTPATAQAPPIAIGCGKKCEQPDGLHVLPSVTIPDDRPAVGTLTTHANPECPIPNPGGSGDRISSRCTASLIAAYSP
ncbi:UNVERIFIED_ORG: hypothetical protein GGR78_001314 [Xanthomonas campestris]